MRLAMMIVATGPVLSHAQKTQIQSEEHDRERREPEEYSEDREKRLSYLAEGAGTEGN
jgi:hypothetical protein